MMMPGTAKVEWIQTATLTATGNELRVGIRESGIDESRDLEGDIEGVIRIVGNLPSAFPGLFSQCQSMSPSTPPS